MGKRAARQTGGPYLAPPSLLRTRTKSKLLQFSINAITGGTEAQGEVTVRLEEKGQTVIGQGADTDVIVASAKAYINALNKIEFKKQKLVGLF